METAWSPAIADTLQFSSPVAARLAGITPGQLTHWTLTEIAIPSIDPGRGQGTRKRWSFTDIVGLRVIRELLAAGLSLKRVRGILPALHGFTGCRHTLRDLGRARLAVLPDDEVAIAHDRKTLVSLIPDRGQDILSTIVIALHPALADVRTAMLAEGLSHEVDTLKRVGLWAPKQAA